MCKFPGYRSNAEKNEDNGFEHQIGVVFIKKKKDGYNG